MTKDIKTIIMILCLAIAALAIAVVATSAHADGIVKMDGAAATFSCIPPTTHADGSAILSTSVLTFKLYVTQNPAVLGSPFSVTTGVCSVTKPTTGMALGQWHSFWTATETPAAPNVGGPESKPGADSPFVVSATPITFGAVGAPGNVPVK